MRFAWIVLAGCDSVIGLAGVKPPLAATPLCVPTTFDGIAPTDVVKADDIALPEDRSFAVVVSTGTAYERDAVSGQQTAIELGGIVVVQPVLSPEGDTLYFTDESSDPFATVAIKHLGPMQWGPDGAAPAAGLVGYPSARRYGARHIVGTIGLLTQEYIETTDGWVEADAPYQPADL